MKMTPLITTLLALPFALNSYGTTLTTQTVLPYECKTCENLPHETVMTHWAIQKKTLGHETQHEQISKKYSLNTTFKELEKGINLYTQAPGAIIRISRQLSAIKPGLSPKFKPFFQIKTKKRGLLNLNEASNLIASGTDLNDTYFSTNTEAILALKPELGAGKFTIIATPAAGHENEQYRINIFDKQSLSALAIKTDKANYHVGEKLTITVSFSDQSDFYPIDEIRASLVSPNGNKTPLILTKKDQGYTAIIPLPTENTITIGANWYVETETTATVDGNIVMREAHTAFSYAIPSAVIREISPEISDPLTVKMALDIATGSRYGVQAVLFVKDSNGHTTPIEVSQTSAWLAPGSHNVTLMFAPQNKTLNATQLYLGSIQLIDYGQMKEVFEYNDFLPINRPST